ncbi:DUF2218 domain-containing protein [Mycolicibacterium sp.]|uniref:DUF2218 domain-containing protein n=1 Tax=Mycolicibacterium sp. TaxID=2320850 RepID=UPI0037C70FF9
MEFRAVAEVPTDAAARYAKQLLAHMSHKVAVEEVEGQPLGGRLVFAYGTAAVLPGPDRLTLRATAADTESLARVQDVVSRHLQRFGARRAIVVRWRTDTES